MLDRARPVHLMRQAGRPELDKGDRVLDQARPVHITRQAGRQVGGWPVVVGLGFPVLLGKLLPCYCQVRVLVSVWVSLLSAKHPTLIHMQLRHALRNEWPFMIIIMIRLYSIAAVGLEVDG